jgi:hypothetical protein
MTKNRRGSGGDGVQGITFGPLDFAGIEPQGHIDQSLFAGLAFECVRVEMCRMEVNERPDSVRSFRAMTVPGTGDPGTLNHQLLIREPLITPEQLPECQGFPFTTLKIADAGDSPEPFVGVSDDDASVFKSIDWTSCIRPSWTV